MSKVIKSCAFRWEHDDCEGMYEGFRHSRYCPTCKKRRQREVGRANYWRYREAKLAKKRAYIAECKAIREKLALTCKPR